MADSHIKDLETQNKVLTRICCALHYRLAGGQEVKIPNSEFHKFSGKECISVKADRRFSCQKIRVKIDESNVEAEKDEE